MAQLALFNEGYETISQYVGIFVWDFLWPGGFIWFPLHMAMVWYLTRGAGIPAPSDTIDVCVDRRGFGFPAPPQGRRPEDLGHRADERKPLFA